jgi:hypothetical protein
VGKWKKYLFLVKDVFFSMNSLLPLKNMCISMNVSLRKVLKNMDKSD